MRTSLFVALGETALVLTACSNQAPSPGDDVLGLEPAESNVECTVNGNGTLPNGDRFAGHATRFLDGSAVGHWVHLTGDDLFEGRINALGCFINGSSLGVLQGNGRWNGEPDYTLELAVRDDNPTDYIIRILDPTATLVYEVDDTPNSGHIVVEGR